MPTAVVRDQKRAPSVARIQANHNIARLPVLDGVVHRLLRDVVKVRRHGVIVDQHRRSHSNRQEIPNRSSTSAAQSCNADINPCASETTGSRPRASSRVLWIASFTSFTILAASAASCYLLFSQLRFVNLGHEGDSRQMLAQAIVQVLADAPLFPCTDVQQRSLQLLPLGDVDSGGNDVVGRSIAAGQAWSWTRQSADASPWRVTQ